ncbi:hypothetical protein [Desulfopila aestuarii]|uniref:EF-hand domain-containing protein n=1 Tax=Desulfopila aestuarii DSM 18488 TaxID=1121416 RepID=A0A1M7Y621_9BACT|nr:hypothetical protein [Desulfopila aestuarii]SHO47974.1 hypothetical protein SAMN02745220_02079 [Desulfopila aestuarii DSM 18488]
MEKTSGTAHRWRFHRLGGFDQVRLEREEDIRNLGTLDQKLWAALSCPVNGLEFDTKTLAMLDSDGDGRVRVQEILAAVNWISTILANLGSFMAGTDSLPLAAINDQHDEGRHLLASARKLLTMLGKGDGDSISIDDVAQCDSLLIAARFNGDGIISPDTAADDATRQLIEEIMSSVGSEPDRSNTPGISLERIETFFSAASAYAAWWVEGTGNAENLPFGDNTQLAATVFTRIRSKIDDYFLRAGLAAFDPGAATPMNPSLSTYETLAAGDLTQATSEIESFPLAHIRASQPLPLRDGLNPAWAADIATLSALVIEPLFGTIDALEKEQWQKIKTTFAPYESWQSSKAGVEVDALGIERVQEILAGPGRQALKELIEEDLAPAEQIADMAKVVQLVHFNRDLYRLLRNFVSFSDFYSKRDKAVFQAGTLYIDGRACELCIKVQDATTHSAMANLGRTYLAYLNCQRRNSAEKMVIAAAFTGGDSDNLMVGRNGVFYDCQGNDWDATIIKIVDHPISVRQAFWSPYKRITRMIGEQIEKFAAAKDKAVDSQAGAGITDMGAKAKDPKAAPAAPFDVAKFAGIFAAIGLAIGAIGTAIASIFGVFLSLPIWQMPLAIGGVILAISGPSMLIAYLKLRQRNLGPMLDANGWAVNTKAGINIPFGATLTRLAELPKGSERSLIDPFAEKKPRWKSWLFLLLLFIAVGFAWQKGYIIKGISMLQQQSTAEKTIEQPAQPPAPPAKK